MQLLHSLVIQIKLLYVTGVQIGAFFCSSICVCGSLIATNDAVKPNSFIKRRNK